MSTVAIMVAATTIPMLSTNQLSFSGTNVGVIRGIRRGLRFLFLMDGYFQLLDFCKSHNEVHIFQRPVFMF